VTGKAAETDTGFPTTTGAFQTAFGGGFFDAFVAKLSSVTTTPFAAFHARVEIEHERHEREFEVKGTFTLGAGSDGIHPLTEDVTLEVGAFAATIPKGSFRRHGHGPFKFEGVAGDARLEVKIRARGGNRFEIKAEGKGAQVGTATPVTVRLAVGDDAGSTLARVKADDD